MAEEQVRPLAPATDRHHSSSDDEEIVLKKTARRKKYIKLCGFMLVIIVLSVVVVVTLIFTIFKVKDPEIKMNGVTVDKIDLINGTIPRPGTNMSLTADISVKNPNFSSFRYKNTTTSLYYHGAVIGEARGPPGQSKARRTTRMNITIAIIVDSLLGNPELQNDLGTGLLTMSSYTSVGGRVKFLTFIKKHVSVRMNCTMKFNISSRSIEDQKCKRKVKL
ncbi:late embryogenesis abundant protein At1g64065 [Rutidosis leptorrhynchoides]|uniref:late embryogenesis abundant protein At1g64065 n=1 Tax=Rutidosis leptorrhynchoides TaxID=125765 RepID=UPI003A99BC7D